MLLLFSTLIVLASVQSHFPSHFTKINPIALIFLSPLSAEWEASFPQVLSSSWFPPVPNPILESQVIQSFWLLPIIPTLALAWLISEAMALNPSMVQLDCKEACPPIRFFHVSRPSDVLRYCPSAISEYKESAVLLMTINFACCSPWIFILRQILKKDVFQ